ncbi:MAG: M23 family metallopeptidase [Minisyncoccia bacterium]
MMQSGAVSGGVLYPDNNDNFIDHSNFINLDAGAIHNDISFYSPSSTSNDQNSYRFDVVKSTLVDLKGYFIMPVQGYNWGILHSYNAVDIAAPCGRPVKASASGLILELSGDDSWNDGYGNYVFIGHLNGTKTRYAHLSKVLVKVGDYVSQGDVIGLVGNTGNTHGPTGCHVHFEVYGAKNPFARS